MKKLTLLIVILFAIVAQAQSPRVIQDLIVRNDANVKNDLDVDNDLNVDGDAQIDGDLNVDGTITGSVSGSTTGTHTGDVVGGDITADLLEMNAGGYIKPIDGTTAEPAIIWDEGEGESDGIAHSTDSIDFIIDSTEVVTVEDDGVHGDLTGNVTGDVSGDVTGNLTGDVTGNLTGDSAGTHTGAVSFPAGSVGAPSIYPTGDPDTGFYSGTANTLYAATSGVLRLTIYDSYVASTVPLRVPLGAANAVSIYGVGATNNGFYFPSTSSVAVATGGVQRCGWDSTGTSSVLGFQPTGSYSQSIYRTNYATDTGIGGSSTSVTLRIGGTEYENIQAGTETRLYSGGEFSRTLTNYYTGADHNKLLLRAARGASGSPDYLDDDDVVGRIKFEAMDGSGTWGDGAEIRVSAIEDHASGETGTKLSIYATEQDSDTQSHIASFKMCRLLPGVLDLDVACIDGRGFRPETLGGNYAFGYVGDITSPVDLSAYTGVTITRWDNAFIGLMLGLDGGIYFGDGSTNALSDDTWRILGDGSERLVFYQYNSGGASWTEVFGVDESGIDVAVGDVNVTSGDLNLVDGDVVASADDAFYLGAKDTDGSWRITRDGNNLVMQRRESGTWTTKDTITP